MQDNTATNVPLLLKAAETAKTLAISPRKLWSMTASGEIPHVRLGRSVRYPFNELQALIDALTRGGDHRQSETIHAKCENRLLTASPHTDNMSIG